MPFRLSSTDFGNGQPIPRRYTADGDDLSPYLEWNQSPAGAKSLALIVRDRDAPGGSFIHWVVYNLIPDLFVLPPGIPKVEVLRDLYNARQGRNSGNRIGYLGPAPPDQKTHHYHFELYALDTVLEPRGLMTADQLEEAMRGHILAVAEVVGTYRRAQAVRRAA